MRHRAGPLDQEQVTLAAAENEAAVKATVSTFQQFSLLFQVQARRLGGISPAASTHWHGEAEPSTTWK